MRAALAGRPAGGFPRPDDRVVEVVVDVGRDCLPNRFTPAARVARVAYLAAGAPKRTCLEPDGPLPGVVPAMVGVPVGQAAAWLDHAGLAVVQRLRVDGRLRPGTVLAQSPAGGTARGAGTPVELTVAVDRLGFGGLGVALVPEVLGRPEAAARELLGQAGLGAVVVAGCDSDAARAADRPGWVWRSGPAPGSQTPNGRPVRLWVNPPGCQPPAPAPGTSGPASGPASGG
jgi:hypothetical protein